MCLVLLRTRHIIGWYIIGWLLQVHTGIWWLRWPKWKKNTGSEVSKQSVFLTSSNTFFKTLVSIVRHQYRPILTCTQFRTIYVLLQRTNACVCNDGSGEKRGEGEKKRFLTCSFVYFRCGIVETVQRRIHEIWKRTSRASKCWEAIWHSNHILPSVDEYGTGAQRIGANILDIWKAEGNIPGL